MSKLNLTSDKMISVPMDKPAIKRPWSVCKSAYRMWIESDETGETVLEIEFNGRDKKEVEATIDLIVSCVNKGEL